MKKIGKVILFPSSDVSDILVRLNEAKYWGKSFYPVGLIESGWAFHHLYIGLTTHDEIIEKGDFFYEISSGKIMKWNFGYYCPYGSNDEVYKIIASTDRLLGLPLPSPEYVRQFVDEYGKHDSEAVEIEFTAYKPKLINDHIVIDKVKKIIYTEEEVIKLLHLALATGSAYGEMMDEANANSWIENNKKK